MRSLPPRWRSMTSSPGVTTPRHRVAAGARLMVCLTVVAGVASAAAQEVNPRAQAIFEFQKRVADYVSLHKREAGRNPKLKETDSPQQIASREKQLGEAIRAARAGAKPGDLFEPVAGIIREVVAQDWAKRSAAERKALQTEVPKPMRVRPNTVYPTKKPLATSPPALIEALPRLPDELEYRFLSRHLILRDVKANIIVDVLKDVVPRPS
jgi:hypothetical protein